LIVGEYDSPQRRVVLHVTFSGGASTTWPRTAVRSGGYSSYHPRVTPPQAGPDRIGRPDLTTTTELLTRVRQGDHAALEALLERTVPALRRWARGRLPRSVRGALDTQDLVQETVVQTMRRLESFEPHHEGALQAYLRQAILNRIRDEIRKHNRHGAHVPLDDRQPDGAASPLQIAIGAERLEKYERALTRLRPSEREAIVARLELQYDYEQLALALGKPTANAARVALKRAVARLLEEMNRNA
jgi:RNA polymerase sigma factor (sigma-70 family)